MNWNSKSLLALLGALSVTQLSAAQYEWTFNAGNLTTSLGNGTMAYADAQTGTLTTYGTTDGTTVPHIGGVPANFMRVPVFPSRANGYQLTFNDTAPNGGGAYVNDYTVVMDFLYPGALGNYSAILNTNPGNPDNNDADFYLHPNGGLGIGTYSPAGTVTQNTWYRAAFVNTASSITIYLNGNQVHTRANDGVDGRWSLFSNLDAGADLLLFNEGDTSGNYTGEWVVNSVAFVDRAMSGAELLGLAGPNATAILVPEPSTITLALLGVGISALCVRRKTNSRRA